MQQQPCYCHILLFIAFLEEAFIRNVIFFRSRKQRLTAVGIRCAGHVTPLYPQKLAVTSPTGGGHSVGIVRLRTKATEFSLGFLIFFFILHYDQQMHNYFTNYHTATRFHTVMSSSDSL